MRYFVILALAALAACSSQPPTSEPKASPVAAAAQEANQSASARTASADDSSSGTASGSDSASKEQTRQAVKIPPGWKPIEREDGETVYCKTIVERGSRFTRKLCYTYDHLQEVLARAQSQADDITRASRVCVTGAVCTNN